MAWSIVGVGSVVETTTTTHTLTEPAGCAAGDLLVACFAIRSTATTSVTMANEWCAARESIVNNVLTTTSASATLTMAYIIRGSSAPALTFTHPAGISVAIGRIVAYRETPTIGLDIETSLRTAVNITAVSVSGMTTTSASDLVVAMVAGGQEAAWSAFKSANAPSTASGATDTTTAPSTTTWIERADSSTLNGAQTSLAIFDAVKTATGATGNFTCTASLGAVQAVASLAFRKATTIANAWSAAEQRSFTLSNSDKTATATAGANVYSTTGCLLGTAGKFYAEILASTVGGGTSNIGMRTRHGTRLGTVQFIRYNGVGNIFNDTTNVKTMTAYTSGDILCFALDAGGKLVWVRKNGGNWNDDAAADPATGTNGIDISAYPDVMMHLFLAVPNTSVDTIRTQLAAFTQTVPSGFMSWMGESVSANKSITAVAGSYALTGTAASLEKSRFIIADVGSYALTGTAATLTKSAAVTHYNLPAASGSYALTGTATSLELGKEVLATAGSHALTGTPASLEYGREIAAVAGSYAVTGTIATFRRAWETIADAGSYALTGTPANLLQPNAYAIIGLPGSYAVSGTATDLEWGREAVAAAGSYALGGQATSLELGREVVAAAGSYALTGTAATFRRTWTATAVSGSYAITGTPVNLLTVGARAIIGLPGSYALTGAAASLEMGREVLALGGSYALSGVTTSLERGLEVLASNGFYAVSGATATFIRARRVAAVGGSYSLSGLPANLLRFGAYAIIGLPGAYTLNGSTATLLKTTAAAYAIIAEAGSYHLTGSPVSLIWSGEGVPVTPPGGMPYWGRASGISKKELKKAVRELLEREERARKRKKPKEIAKEIIAAIEPQGLGVAERRIVRRLISQALLSQLPQMFYSQPLIHDKEQLERAILFIIEAAMQRILDEEEDEEAALLLLSVA